MRLRNAMNWSAMSVATVVPVLNRLGFPIRETPYPCVSTLRESFGRTSR